MDERLRRSGRLLNDFAATGCRKGRRIISKKGIIYKNLLTKGVLNERGLIKRWRRGKKGIADRMRGKDRTGEKKGVERFGAKTQQS